MDMQSGIRTRLLNDARVADLVGTRVDWGQRSQATAYPAIVLQTISDPRPANLKGYEKTRGTLVQMDVYAKEYETALIIARAAIAVLKDPRKIGGKKFGPTFVDGQRDSLETSGTTNIHRQSVDLNIWHVGE